MGITSRYIAVYKNNHHFALDKDVVVGKFYTGKKSYGAKPGSYFNTKNTRILKGVVSTKRDAEFFLKVRCLQFQLYSYRFYKIIEDRVVLIDYDGVITPYKSEVNLYKNLMVYSQRIYDSQGLRKLFPQAIIYGKEYFENEEV